MPKFINPPEPKYYLVWLDDKVMDYQRCISVAGAEYLATTKKEPLFILNEKFEVMQTFGRPDTNMVDLLKWGDLMTKYLSEFITLV
jgi:hypothetical protein